MGNFDLIALWIGRGVLVAGAIGLAASVVVGFNFLAGLLFWTYARKVGFTRRNFYDVRQWIDNGRPKWRFDEDNVTRMHPTAALRKEPSAPGEE